VLVEAQIGNELLELAVLVFELLQPPQFAQAQTTVELLAVKRLLGDAHPAQHLCDRCPGLGLLQRESDLLFGEPTLLHGCAPPFRSLKPETSLSGRTKAMGGRQARALS
jgi:hypothetical protein